MLPVFSFSALVRSNTRGSDAGDQQQQAAMWDDFRATLPQRAAQRSNDRTTKSSTSATKSRTTLRESMADTKDDTEAITQPRRSALLPCLSATSTWYAPHGALVTIKVVEAYRCQPKDHGRKIYEQIETKRLTEARRMPACGGTATTRTADTGSSRTHLYDANDWDNMYSLHRSDKIRASPEYPVDKVFTVEGKLRREHLRTAMRSHRCHERGHKSIGSQVLPVQGCASRQSGTRDGAGTWPPN